MEGAAGNEQLNALAATQIRSDDDPLRAAVVPQQEHLERIAEVKMVELVIVDAVKPHGRV